MSFDQRSIALHLTQPGVTLDVRESVSSTNTLLKQMGRNGAPHGYVLAASHQTAGRGRMGRNFYSPEETGVYFSVLLRPDLSPADSLLITTAAAVAAARALERISGKEAKIKWVNDIYIEGRKVSGILTEAAFTPDGKGLAFAVLGIGINLYPPKEGFPEDIRSKAGSVINGTQDDLRGYLTAQVLNEFFDIYPSLKTRSFVEEYRSRSMLTGLTVDVLKPDSTRPAVVLEVTEDLALAVQYDTGEVEHLTSGDVSIRPNCIGQIL